MTRSSSVIKATKPPLRALWEITWACDLRCDHCLVDGGAKRDSRELDREEAFGLVDALAELGVAVVSLTGGEPLLRPDWLDIAARVRERGMTLRVSSNGHLLTARLLGRLVELETDSFCVSVDGVRETHDAIRHGAGRRGGPSSFDRVTASLELLRDSPISTQVITTVTRANVSELAEVQELLKALGVNHWIVQLGHPTGRLAEARERFEVTVEIAQAVADFIVSRSDDPQLQPAAFNSIGWLHAREPQLRKSGRRARNPIWRGCTCGKDVIGIEPDGGVKGCANQVGEPFVVGNIRQESLEVIWNDRPRWFWLDPSPEQMTGVCKDCALAPVCHAGCTVMAYRSTGELFNNPFCLRAHGRKG
jgi:radical SAM protein with 4Fe4S-binding SPASM domain